MATALGLVKSVETADVTGVSSFGHWTIKADKNVCASLSAAVIHSFNYPFIHLLIQPPV